LPWWVYLPLSTLAFSWTRFRTAGFPQYGFKVGFSKGACPRATLNCRAFMVCILTSCSPLSAFQPPLCVGDEMRSSTAIRADCTALPQGSSLPSGLFCPGPSSLNRPHPPHSLAHLDFAALRFIRDALAVRFRLGDPRVVPCFRCPVLIGTSPSETPGSSSVACTQFLRRRRWPSFSHNGLGTSEIPTIRFPWGNHFGA
jgi:hypothetical protein